MNPKTLIIDFVPELKKETPSALRNKKYAEDILDKYDLGEVIICSGGNYTELVEKHDPFIVISTNDYEAEQIKSFKPEVTIYVAVSVTSVFSRKIEIDKKKEKNRKIFEDASSMVKRIRESSDKEIEQLKKFNAMSYNEMYDMIKKALISDDENLRKQAWDLLFGDGEKHSNFIWMKMQVLCEAWEKTDNKGREELMCMTMNQFVDEGIARKIDNYTDEEGQEYHQYMMINFYKQDTEYIRKIPLGDRKEKERYGYEALLEKNEVPANFLRLNIELNQIKDQREEFFNDQREKIRVVLKRYDENPKLSKKELGVAPWDEKDDVNEPLAEKELNSLKNFLNKK